MSAKYYHGADDGKYKKMGELRLRCSPCADFELRLMCNHVGCIGLHWNPEPLLKTFDVDRVGFVRLGRSAAMREALARARPPVRALERATTLAIRAAPRAAVADGPAAADPLLILSKETVVLDALRAKGKCLLLFSNDVLGRITVGSEVIVGRSGVWYDGVVRKLPGRRKRQKTKAGGNTNDELRLFHVQASGCDIPNPIAMEFGHENYAQGCIAPSSRSDQWAWACVAIYVACANVACGKCLAPYETAVGHACVKCKVAVHNLCSQKYAGVRDLGADLCFTCS